MTILFIQSEMILFNIYKNIESNKEISLV